MRGMLARHASWPVRAFRPSRRRAAPSGAEAGTLGRTDGHVTRDEALAHCRAIVEATDLPVSADLEKGFGDEPESAAETIRLAAEVGLVGGSIEDATGQPDRPLSRR